MANLRHTLLVRTDLNLPVGLLAAQIAHLHFETFRKRINEDKTISFTSETIANDVMEWLKDPYLFIHRVPNLEALEYFMMEFDEKTTIPVVKWSDTIYLDLSPTQKRAFEDVLIGIAIGPTDSDRIKAIIGDLPLL